MTGAQKSGKADKQKAPAAQTAPAPVKARDAKPADLVRRLAESYWQHTPQPLKLIDAYMAFILVTGVLQFIYMLVFGTFPYNAFLAGFASTVASFVFAANLRIQTNPDPSNEFKSLSPERAFVDFIVCHLVLHIFVVNFLG